MRIIEPKFGLIKRQERVLWALDMEEIKSASESRGGFGGTIFNQSGVYVDVPRTFEYEMQKKMHTWVKVKNFSIEHLTSKLGFTFHKACMLSSCYSFIDEDGFFWSCLWFGEKTKSDKNTDALLIEPELFEL